MLATAAQFKKLLLDIHLYRSLAPWGCFRRNVTRKKESQDQTRQKESLRKPQELWAEEATLPKAWYPGHSWVSRIYLWENVSQLVQYTEGDSQGAQGFSNKTPIKSGLKRDCRSRCFIAKL